MAQELEIEYKTMLTEAEYQLAINKFGLENVAAFTQTNLYFDTAASDLKNQHCGLRVRYFQNAAEATLKIPQNVGLLEVTDKLTLIEAKNAEETGAFPKNTPAIQEQLQKNGVIVNNLQLLAILTTKRIEQTIAVGKLALDESWYAGLHDFELELEVQDSQTSEAEFLTLLKEAGIYFQPAKNKILRAISAQSISN
ncbi:CYTH domain-containing protein [Enterococcus alishanensis]|nr:CYTH domain-containing protein [Enterococcus alishanensis]